MSEIKIEQAYHQLVRTLSEKEYDELKASIKTHGLLVPIVVNQDGIILDGHNRYQICQELGIKPVVIRKEFKSKAHEKLFVIESNLKRRHLTEIEKVELAMQLEPLEKELAHERQKATLKVGDKVPSVSNETHGETGENPAEDAGYSKGRAADKVAKRVGLSATQYHRGKTVLENGSDEIKEEVKTGKTSISSAYEKVKGKTSKADAKRHLTKQAIDILILPEEQWVATENAIEEARVAHDKQVVLRHNKHEVTGVGKEIEISTC